MATRFHDDKARHTFGVYQSKEKKYRPASDFSFAIKMSVLASNASSSGYLVDVMQESVHKDLVARYLILQMQTITDLKKYHM